MTDTMQNGNKLKDWLWRFKANRKAQLVLLIAIIVLVAFGVGAVIAVNMRNNQRAVVNPVPTNAAQIIPAPAVYPRLLDGVLVGSQEEALAFPVGVMIENLSTVRPQRGLGEAGVVYEALAEGGITRFFAIYAGPQQLQEIGPVRSAREYFVSWAEEYGLLYAHVGGSPAALGRLSNNPYLTDLNQIGGDQAYFWRDSSTAAPHNLLTSSEKLSYAVRDRVGEDKRATFEPWVFTDEQGGVDGASQVNSFILPFSSFSYEVRWDYDAANNTYKRSNGGEEHTDALTGEVIRANTVVVQFVDTTLQDSSTGRLEMSTEGTGRAVVFLDGLRIDGTWKKPDRTSRTKFYNSQGAEVRLNPGHIWVEVLPSDRDITIPSAE